MSDHTPDGKTPFVPKRRKRASCAPARPTVLAGEEAPDSDGGERMSPSLQHADEQDHRYQLPVDPADLPALNELTGQATASEEQILQWLTDHGYDFPRDAVRRHQRVLDQLLLDMRRAAAASLVVLRVADVDASDANVALVEQSLTQSLYEEMHRKGRLDGESWLRIGRILGKSIDCRIGLERLRKLASARVASTSGAALNLLRAMTARQVAERVRDALVGPPPIRVSAAGGE